MTAFAWLLILVVVMKKDESFDASERTIIKITDFDQIREQDHSKVTTCAGTYAWMAPEVLNDCTTFHKTSDVWRSVLILLLLLLQSAY